jgi:hypothetical protein
MTKLPALTVSIKKLLLLFNCEAMFAYSSQAMTFRMPGEGRHSPANKPCQPEKKQNSTALCQYVILVSYGTLYV